MRRFVCGLANSPSSESSRGTATSRPPPMSSMPTTTLWLRRRRPASLHKPAREAFGLTQDVIARAIRAGKLHYREGSMHGNPWLRLLRCEVEALVRAEHGNDYLKDRQAKTELAGINRELRRLKAQIARLE